MSMLYEELLKLYNSDEYPFHMPGHKRQDLGCELDQAYHMDITEIMGYDNLYDAGGILKEAMDYAGRLYGCPNTYFLVNGSTAGILIAIHAVTSMYKNRRLLIASNCHRSVRAGAMLTSVDTDVLDVAQVDGFGVYGAVSPEEAENRLRSAKEAGSPYAAVVITSPTYGGILSDIEAIANVCHRYDTILVVDEAHGAHLDLCELYPGGALRYGADIVIHSTHKTLAAMTQTALLHVQGKLVDISQIEKYWSLLQTSSPSYVLMASIDLALHHFVDHPDMVRDHLLRLTELRGSFGSFKELRVLTKTDTADKGICVDLDPYKIVISTMNTYIDGYTLQNILLKDHHIQVELAGDDGIILITTYMDTSKGLERLKSALSEIDDRLSVRYYNEGSTLQAHRDIPEDRRSLYAPCISSKEVMYG